MSSPQPDPSCKIDILSSYPENDPVTIFVESLGQGLGSGSGRLSHFHFDNHRMLITTAILDAAVQSLFAGRITIHLSSIF